MSHRPLLSDIVQDRSVDLVSEWGTLQQQGPTARPDLISLDQLARQATGLLTAIDSAARSDGRPDRTGRELADRRIVIVDVRRVARSHPPRPRRVIPTADVRFGGRRACAERQSANR